LFKPEIYEVKMSLARMLRTKAKHYRITDSVTQVNTGISKSDAGE